MGILNADFIGVIAREWLVSPVFIALAVLPGLGFAGLAARHVRFSWPETIAASFAFAVALTSAVATVCYYTGLSLDVVLVAYLGLIPLSLWFFIREYRNGHLKKPALEAQGLVIGGGAALLAMIERPWFRSGADAFYHLAAVRSLLATNRPLVTDPFHGTNTNVLDPTSGVWHTIQAVITRALFTDIATLQMGVAALGAGIAMLCFWILARRVSGDARAATIASIVMAAVAYHFDFRVMAYPRHVSEALAFFGIALLARLIDEPKRRVVTVAAFVGMATVTMHLAAAEFFFLAGAVLLLGLGVGAWVCKRDSGEVCWKREAKMVALALGLAALLSVPVLLPRVGALSGSSVIGSDSYLDISSQVIKLGPVALLVKPGGIFTGGPLVYLPMLALLWFLAPIAFRKRDPHALAVFSLVAMQPLALTNPLFTPFALWFSSYMVARMAILMRFLPFLGIAWALAYVLPGREEVLARFAKVAIALALVAGIPDLFNAFTGIEVPLLSRGLDVYPLIWTYQTDVRESWGVGTLAKMRAEFGNRYPVVAAEDYTGFYFAGIEPVVIVSTPRGHSPASLAPLDGPIRRKAMREFFDAAALPEDRLAVIRKYHIDYVVIWKVRLDPEVEAGMLAQDGIFKLVVSSPRIDLLKVTDPGGV